MCHPPYGPGVPEQIESTILEPETPRHFQDIIYVLGLGTICGYYGLTCVMFILAFILRKPTVILHLNLFGELSIEFIITILSIPCAIYAVKESIKSQKRMKKCTPDEDFWENHDKEDS